MCASGSVGQRAHALPVAKRAPVRCDSQLPALVLRSREPDAAESVEQACKRSSARNRRRRSLRTTTERPARVFSDARFARSKASVSARAIAALPGRARRAHCGRRGTRPRPGRRAGAVSRKGPKRDRRSSLRWSRRWRSRGRWPWIRDLRDGARVLRPGVAVAGTYPGVHRTDCVRAAQECCRMISPSSSGVSGGSLRCTIRWQLAQSTARSVAGSTRVARRSDASGLR